MTILANLALFAFSAPKKPDREALGVSRDQTGQSSPISHSSTMLEVFLLMFICLERDEMVLVAGFLPWYAPERLE